MAEVGYMPTYKVRFLPRLTGRCRPKQSKCSYCGKKEEIFLPFFFSIAFVEDVFVR
jgi:hypothetical protein